MTAITYRIDNWYGRSYEQTSSRLGDGTYRVLTRDLESGYTQEETVRIAGATGATWLDAVNTAAARTGYDGRGVMENLVERTSLTNLGATGPSAGATVASVTTTVTPRSSGSGSSGSAYSASLGASPPPGASVTTTTVTWSDGFFMTYVSWPDGDGEESKKAEQSNRFLVAGQRNFGSSTTVTA